MYYDILGLTFITYSEEMGQILNYGAAGITLILVFISAWRMSAVSQLPSNQVWRRLIILVILQSIGFVLALALPLVVAYILDSFGLSLTYFSTLSLVIGLYVCPALIGLCLPITVYYHTQDNVSMRDCIRSNNPLNVVRSRANCLSPTTFNWRCIAGPFYCLFWPLSLLLMDCAPSTSLRF